jgi:hypothetical protein
MLTCDAAKYQLLTAHAQLPTDAVWLLQTLVVMKQRHFAFDAKIAVFRVFRSGLDGTPPLSPPFVG